MTNEQEIKAVLDRVKTICTFAVNQEKEKQDILGFIQALKEKKGWALEQTDIILDKKEEYETRYNEKLPWID